MGACRYPQDVATAGTWIGEQIQSNPRALPNGGQAIGPHLVVDWVSLYAIKLYIYIYYLSFKGVFRIKKDEGKRDDNKWEGDRALLYAINDFDLACHLMVFFFFFYNS